jgi:adenosylhomocysteine nucleosidase
MRILAFCVLVSLSTSCGFSTKHIRKLVIISANAEWDVVKEVFASATIQRSPWGEYFETEIPVGSRSEHVLFFHGGWGKVAAAGSTQYCIDQWHPDYLINLGTCGGFDGKINRFSVILVDKTIIYDILEAMGDPDEAIRDYTTQLDLSWLNAPLPINLIRSVMVSADRDLVATEIPMLQQSYGAIAGDWETGAIAYTCKRNHQRVLILRGVSDLVDIQNGGEAYNKPAVYVSGTGKVMKDLLNDLPLWLEKCQ